MTLDEWRFSMRIAWDNPAMRWAGIGTWAILVPVSLFAAYRLFVASMPTGIVVTHYTVYLGIDQMLPSYWIPVIITMPIAVVSGTIATGYGLFRQDSLAGAALVTLSVTSSLIWVLYLFSLIKINY